MSEKLAINTAELITEQCVSLENPTDWQFPYGRLTAKDILTFTDGVITHVEDELHQILENDELTWDSVMAPLSAMSEKITQLVSPVYVLSRSHPSRKVRDAASEAELRINLYDNSIWHRTELFDKIRAYSETEEARDLSDERARYLHQRMQSLIERGHDLAPQDRARMRELDDLMSVHVAAYNKNITKAKGRLTLSEKALKGMPESYLKSIKPDKKGKYIIDINPGNATLIIGNVSNRDTREKVSRAIGSLAVNTNGPLLEEMRMIRHETAGLLGHESWAHLQLSQLLLRSPDEVRALYRRLIDALRPKAEAEVAAVAKMLRADGYDDDVRTYDMTYYASKQLTEKDLADGDEIIQYFPVEHVLKKIFEIDRELYGLKYKRMKDVPVWHEDVLVYGLYHENTDELRAVFYMDLFARKGKSAVDFQIPMQVGRRLPDGSYRPTVGAMVTDFTPSPKGMPPLLAIPEIHTFLHEKGHFLALALSEAEISEFTIGNYYFMGRDYMELPSQVEEKRAEDVKILHRISRHYVSGKKISRKKIERYLETQKINEASAKLARYVLHLTDLDMHDVQDGRSVEGIFRENTRIGNIPYDDGTMLLATDSHMTDYAGVTAGYDVTEVFAYDIFQKFKTAGLTSRQVGDEFRNKMLRYGGSKDGMEMVRDILGREPNPDAYLKNLGVS